MLRHTLSGAEQMTSQSPSNKDDRRKKKTGEQQESGKRQPDGSKVTTPPTDPANSEETLQRNRTGNS